MKKILFLIIFFPFFAQATVTPVWCCGFECGQAGSVGQHFQPISGTASFSTTTVRSGARSGRSNPTSSTGYLSTAVYGGTGSVIRFYIYFATLPNTTTEVFAFRDGTVTGWGGYIVFNSSDSKLYTRSDQSGSNGATGVSVTTGQWYRIDAYYFSNTTGAHTMDAQVDGSALGQATFTTGFGQGQSAASFGIIGQIAASVTADIYYDDIIVSQTSAEYPIGAGNVYHYVPTSDGTHNIGAAGGVQFSRGTTATEIVNATTDSYLLVDEIPLDGTTPTADDFINAASPANATDYSENKFGAATGSTITLTPRAVQVIVEYHQAGTGVGVSAIKLNDNGTEDAIVSLNGAGVTTGRYTSKLYATPPTGGTWNNGSSGNGAFYNLRIRFGYSSDANPDQYFDCAMIEAEFAPDVATVPGTPSDHRLSSTGAGLLAMQFPYLHYKK